MKLHPRATERLSSALSLALIAQVIAGGAAANAQTAPARLAPAVVPIETVVDRDVVYTNVNNDVVTPMPPLPAVQAGVDTLKLQVANRMNSGLLTGQLAGSEADEVQAMLDDVARQEAEFKIGGLALTPGAVNNLMRKYHMVDQRLAQLLTNGNTVDYMPGFTQRRAGMQRRISYNVAAGNLTPVEGEMLLTALSNISDQYASSQATGHTLTATELEALHRDLSSLYGKLVARVSGTIAFTAPATRDKLAQLQTTIRTAEASHRFTLVERRKMLDQYNQMLIMQESLVAHEGARSEDVQVLAKEIDNLDFILTRELHDRQIAGQSDRL